MPKMPRRPCGFPGCPNLTDGRFCEEHAKQENRRYERYQRDPATKRRYGRAWQRIRDRYAAAHPFCEECYKRGVLTPTEEIQIYNDYVIPKTLAQTIVKDFVETGKMSDCVEWEEI